MPIDTDKLAKLLAVAASDQEREATSALRRAKSLLANAGMSFADVAAKLRASAPTPTPSLADAFAGFDDHMESKQPGWKAEQAAKRAARAAREASDRTALIERSGSLEAALAPTERERRVDAAVRHLARTEMKDYLNGRFETETLDGWSDMLSPIPASVRAAVAGALPLPTTVTEAAAEYRFWQTRDREYNLLYEGDCGDTCLSLAAQARETIVRELFLHSLPARSPAEVLLRLEHDLDSGFHDRDILHQAVTDLRRLCA